MKKTFLNLSALVIIAGTITLVGCKKDDVTAPVVTLTGDASQTISLNSTYTDPGATATDDRDDEVTVTSDAATVVMKDSAGTYTVTYKSVDEAGNEGKATREVIVKNDAVAMEGNYDGSETDADGPYTYAGNSNSAKVVTITASKTKNNRVWINRLGDHANNKVYLDITGNDISIPSQSVSNVGSGSASCDVHNRRSSGTGSKTSTGFTLKYSDEKLSPCTGNRVDVNATFTKK